MLSKIFGSIPVPIHISSETARNGQRTATKTTSKSKNFNQDIERLAVTDTRAVRLTNRPRLLDQAMSFTTIGRLVASLAERLCGP